MGLLTELKNRGVTRVAVAYVAVAWLILQVGEMLLPVYGFGDAAIRNLITVLAAGLALAVAFSWFFEWTPGGIVKEQDLRGAGREAGDANGVAAGRSHRFLDRFTILVLGLAVAFFVIDKFMLEPARDKAREKLVAEQARAEALTDSFGDRSIAVLPFRDLSPQGDQSYFSEGVAEEVLNLLASIPELRVTGRASAFSFRGEDQTIARIGQRLNVAHVLDGSVRKAGSRVRITAQLVDARTETQLWSAKYDRNLDDIFAVQDEIAAKVTGELRLRLLGESPTSKVISPEAFEKFLKARHNMRNFSWHADEQAKAEDLLRSLLTKEPDYLPALALLWRLVASGESWRMREDQQATLAEIRERMIAIDPDHVDTLRIQASMAWQEGQPPQQVAALLARALWADAGNIELLRTTVYALLAAQRYDDAIAVGRQLVLREPSCGRCLNALANAFRGSGRYREGIEVLLEASNWGLMPEGYYWNLGVLYLGAGEPAEAMAAWQQENTDFGEVWWLLALHDLGRDEEFQSRFQALRADPAEHPESIARVYAYTGDADQAFAWLDRMFDPGSEAPPVMPDSDIYNPIKADPRWQILLREKFGATDAPEQPIEFTLPPGLVNSP